MSSSFICNACISYTLRLVSMVCLLGFVYFTPASLGWRASPSLPDKHTGGNFCRLGANKFKYRHIVGRYPPWKICQYYNTKMIWTKTTEIWFTMSICGIAWKHFPNLPHPVIVFSVWYYRQVTSNKGLMVVALTF